MEFTYEDFKKMVDDIEKSMPPDYEPFPFGLSPAMHKEWTRIMEEMVDSGEINYGNFNGGGSRYVAGIDPIEGDSKAAMFKRHEDGRIEWINKDEEE